MARKLTPDGRRVTRCAKFSESEAARVDAARGKLTVGEWLRAAALAYMEPPPEPQREPAAKREPRRKRTAPAATFRQPGQPGQPEGASDIMAALRRRGTV